MNTKCPKCGYIRKDTETVVPDWQCPSCGVAYSKAKKPAIQQNSNIEQKEKVEPEQKLASESDQKIKYKTKYLQIENTKFLIIGFICFAIGFLAGREYLRYEMKSVFMKTKLYEDLFISSKTKKIQKY